MTTVGLLALALSIILNRLVTWPLRLPSDDPLIVVIGFAYVAAHWAIWLMGAALVCVGIFRIFAIDISRS
jgi:hypothetical protein